MIPRQSALVVGPATMAFRSMTMKSKKSGGYSPKSGDGRSSFGGPLSERLEDGEEDAAILGHPALLADVVRGDRTIASSGNARRR